ncbi:MAG: carboxypeptidase regulatory-like domain-containing protein [Pyrinomonadaceae bacterium]
MRLPRFLSARLFVAFAVVLTASTALALFGNRALTESRALLAPALSAAKTGALDTTAGGDVNGNSVINPGDRLKYSVVINNNGADAATNVNFSDTLDGNTTFAAGSIIASPVAVNENYSATGNVSISVPAASGILANDQNPNTGAACTVGNTCSISSATGSFLSAQGGNVTLNADGSFTFNPRAGFEGADTFTYTLANGTGLTDTGLVTINVSGMIWFVNNNAGACSASCDGRLSNPFTSLATFNTANALSGGLNPDNNDNIFLYESATAYAGVLTLRAGQRLIGQDATASLNAITGITTPAFSAALPGTNSGNSTFVTITSSGNGINLASGNTLRGFTVGNTTGAKLNAAASVGTLTIGAAGAADVTLNGTGQALNLTGGGSLAANFASISSASSAAAGITLTGLGGNLTSATTSITSPTTVGINLTSSVSGGTFNFGNTTVSSSAGTGIVLGGASAGNANNITFGSLNITPAANQWALLAQNNTGTITTASGTITATGATAVEITQSSGTTPLNVQLTSVSANGGANGIILTNTSSSGSPGGFRILGNAGNCTLADQTCTGGTIQNTTGDGISLSNTANVSLTGTRILNAGRQGIFGRIVNGFTLKNSLNIGAGDGDEESAILFENDATTASVNHTGTALNGTFLIQDVVIDTPTQWGLKAHQVSGTMNMTVQRLTVQNNYPSTFGEQALSIRVDGGTSNVLIDDSDFLTVNSGIDGGTGATGVLNMTVQNNVVNQSEALPFGINFVTGANSTGRLKATGNTLIGCSGGAGQVPTNMCSLGIDLDASTNSTLEAILLNNTISDTGLGGGIEFQVNDDAIGKAEVRDNIVNLAQANKQAMLFRARTVSPNNNDTGSIDVTLEGNTINNLFSTGGVAIGFEINAGTSGTAVTHANRACVNLATQANSGGNVVNGVVTAGLTYAFILRQRPGTTFQLQGYTGGGADANAIQNFVKTNNPGGTMAGETLAGNVINYTNVPCAVPSTPILPPAAAQIASEPFAFSSSNDSSFSNISYTTLVEPLKNIQSLFKYSAKAQTVSATEDISDSESTVKIIETNESTNTNYLAYVTRFMGNAVNTMGDFAGNVGSMISPTVQAETKAEQLTPISGETIMKSLGTLPAGESVTIQFKATINSTPANFYSVSNTANITADGGISINSTTATNTVVQPPSISKAFGKSFIALDGTTTLTYTITNGNSATLSGLSFSDTLPSGLVINTPNGLTNSCGGDLTATQNTSVISLSGGTIGANTTCTVKIDVKGTTEGAKTSTTSVVGSTSGGNGNTATATVNVIAAPTFTKAFGSPTIQLNGSTTLSFTITNASTVFPINNVSFTDTLPAGLVVSTPNALSGACGGGTITANQGSGTISLSSAVIAANTNCTFSVSVKGTSAGVKNNSATVSTTELGTGATATASVTVIAPPTIGKAFNPTSIVAGNSSVVTLTLSNGNTTGALTNASFTDSLSNMTAVGGAAGGTCAGATSNTFAAGATNLSFGGITVPVNGNCTVTFSVTSNVPGVQPNTTSGVTTAQTPVAGSQSNTAELTVIAAATYTISGQITNGGAALEGVSVALSGTSSSSTATDAAGNYSFTNLSGGGSFTVTPSLNGYTFNPVNTPVNNLAANQTAVNFATSVVAYEADTAPRPSGDGDGTVNGGDLTMIRRFVAGIETPAAPAAGSEFQRADSAPLYDANNVLVKGDGGINGGDITQVRRYAAGLDAVQPAGGPAAAVPPPPTNNPISAEGFSSPLAPDLIAATRDVRPVKVSLVGNVLTVAVNLNTDPSLAGANTVGFTLLYDAAVLSNPTNIRSGADAPAAATLTPNTAQSGKVGIVLDLPVTGATTTFPLGDAQLVLIDFTVAANPPASTTLDFGDAPVARFVGDTSGNRLTTTFSAAPVSILGPTAASVTIGGRVMSQNRRGINNVTVSMTDARGTTTMARTNAFGYYRFAEVTAGETYILTAKGKRYAFSQPSQVVNIFEDTFDIDFIGESNKVKN